LAVAFSLRTDFFNARPEVFLKGFDRMSLQELMQAMLPAIETELRQQVARLNEPKTQLFFEMLTYHMGWSGSGAGPEAQGKRIRPLLVILSAAACGENNWLRAMPAAAAVELIHSFSLVHDDIEDHSEKRRGRSTAWKIWDVPMAINLGDALFVLSNQALMDLSKDYAATLVVESASLLHSTCLDLTRGQFLDMSFENRTDVSIDNYWQMIEAKTAALLSACTQIGALLAGADDQKLGQYRIFGRDLGLAFQVQDDILGIWGDEALTGKSAASDLVEGKLSLPVIYAISQKGNFEQLWASSPILPSRVADIAQMLVDVGAYDFCKHEESRLTNQALTALNTAGPQGAAGSALIELAKKLLNRET
jgi:geranylgeranyl diphosphate synthase, type I